MRTIIPLHADSSPTAYAALAALLAADGVAAIPTESSYALAVSPFRDSALGALFRMKRRPGDKPILVLIGDADQLPLLVETIPPAAEVLARSFWPGPLTIVFPSHPSLPARLTAGTGTVGIRLPAVPLLRELLVHVGPLTGTSANRFNQPPLCTAEAVSAELGCDVDLILDAGPTPGGIPSTVIDARSSIRIIREGAVSRAALGDRLHRAGFALSP
ncbi:MAG TPA: L-threonylcarbamoyladenylate synthase [Nitrospiraceae bacterium]|nr:L-threonylcarbamoyladenylate synthase [Nitrospiraceae bacterium]